MDAVLVTHNSADDIRSLIAGNVTPAAFDRVVVVDNCSSDETVAIAGAAGFEVLAQEVNRGLAAGVNIGAQSTRGSIFALLNPDVRLAAVEDLQSLVRHFEDPTVGAVAPALVLPSGEIQDSARHVPTPFDLLLRRLTGRCPDAVRATAVVDVAWAVAAFLVLRRAAFDSVGGMDERFFLYFEDVDLGVRLARAGFRTRYDPSVRVFHDHRAASRSSVLSAATRQHIRSAARFYWGNPRSAVALRRA